MRQFNTPELKTVHGTVNVGHADGRGCPPSACPRPEVSFIPGMNPHESTNTATTTDRSRSEIPPTAQHASVAISATLFPGRSYRQSRLAVVLSTAMTLVFAIAPGDTLTRLGLSAGMGGVSILSLASFLYFRCPLVISVDQNGIAVTRGHKSMTAIPWSEMTGLQHGRNKWPAASPNGRVGPYLSLTRQHGRSFGISSVFYKADNEAVNSVIATAVGFARKNSIPVHEKDFLL